jgi:hypothetical protein
VDLVDVPRPILVRYLGKDGAAAFLAAHGAARDAAPEARPVGIE